jgi:hypothetical protein
VFRTIAALVCLTVIAPGLTLAEGGWTQLDPPDHPSARVGHSLTAVGDSLFLFGGFDETVGRRGDLWRWDDQAETWIELDPTNPPSPRWGHTAVAADERLWVFFGQDGTTNGSIWVYDPATDAWQEVTPPGVDLITRSQAAAVVVSDDQGDQWIVLTGGQGFFFDPLAEAWALRVRDLEFLRLPDLPEGRYGHTMVAAAPSKANATQPVAVAYGRNLEGPIDSIPSISRFDVQDWATLEPTLPGRDSVASTPHPDGDGTIVCGGRDANGFALSATTWLRAVPVGEALRIEASALDFDRPARFDSACAAFVRAVLNTPAVLEFGGESDEGFHNDETWLVDLGNAQAPGGYDLWLVAGNGTGFGGRVWQTDVWMANTGSEPVSLTMTLLPEADGPDPCAVQGPDCPRTSTVTLLPGDVQRRVDLLSSDFGFQGSAALGITINDPIGGVVDFTTRIYSSDGEPGSPTQGQGFPEQDVSKAVAFGMPQVFSNVYSNQRFRTNIGFVNIDPDFPVEIRLTFAEADTGEFLGSAELELDPDGFNQLDDILDLAGIDFDGEAFVIVTVLTEGGRVITYTSTIDEESDDGSIGELIDIADDGRVLIPAAASGSGGTPEFPLMWETDVTLISHGEDAEVIASFLPWNTDNSEPEEVTFNLTAGQVKTIRDSVRTLFDRGGAGAIVFDSDQPLSVTSRTFSYSPTFGIGAGTYGQGIPGQAVSLWDGTEFPDSLSRPQQLTGLMSSPEFGFRSNVGICNLKDQPVTVLVMVGADDGDGEIFEVTLGPNGSTQINDIYAPITQDPVWSGSVVVFPQGLDDAIFVYGSVVDGNSGDGNFIQPFVVPPTL